MPDPADISVDPSFEKYRFPMTNIERLAPGYRLAEGPVYFPKTKLGNHKTMPGKTAIKITNAIMMKRYGSVTFVR